jgi:hypothetical protein
MTLLQNVDRKALNMGRMLKRLQLGPIALAFVNQGRLMNSVVRTCELCRAGTQCEAWLRKSSVPVGQAPAFCPNRRNLELARTMI